MLDYVNWYLVELERRLRSTPESADMLLETRSHLEERVDDLVTKGYDRATATRRAVADFGDPKTIAWALHQGPGQTRRGHWIWATIIAVIACFAFIPGILVLNGVTPASDAVAYYGIGPAIAGILIGLYALRHRTWIAPATMAIATIISLAVGFYAAVGSTPVVVGRVQQNVATYAIAGQVEMRKDWLARSEEFLPKFDHWLNAYDQKDPGARQFLGSIIETQGAGYAAPYLTGSFGIDEPHLLPSDLTNPSASAWISFEQRRYGANFYVANYYTLQDSVRMWEQQGHAFRAALVKEQNQVREELRSLSSIPYLPWWKRLGNVMGAIVPMLLGSAIVAFLINGMGIFAVNSLRGLRVLAWRRKLG